jgi:hypothetical protein
VICGNVMQSDVAVTRLRFSIAPLRAASSSPYIAPRIPAPAPSCSPTFHALRLPWSQVTYQTWGVISSFSAISSSFDLPISLTARSPTRLNSLPRNHQPPRYAPVYFRLRHLSQRARSPIPCAPPTFAWMVSAARAHAPARSPLAHAHQLARLDPRRWCACASGL